MTSRPIGILQQARIGPGAIEAENYCYIFRWNRVWEVP
jgi:hypothetical protein